MLVGRLKYRDEEFGELEYKLSAVEDYGSIKMLVSNVVLQGEKAVDAKLALDREILKGTGEVSYRYNNVSSNFRRLDINKGGTLKTNFVNKAMASRIGGAFLYSLEQIELKTEEEKLFEFTDQEPTIEELLQRSTRVVKLSKDRGHVKYRKGLLTEFYFSGKYVDIFLEEVDGTDILDGQFGTLKQKDKWDNLLSNTKIINITPKFIPEVLGFTYVNQLAVEPPRLFGIYQNLEEVNLAHPHKNTSWLDTRKYIMVTDDTLDEVIADFMAYDGNIAFDTETTGLKITFRSRYGLDSQLVGVVLSKEIGTGYYFPLQHKAFPNLCNNDHKFFMRKYMKKLLETKKIVTHNLSYDWKVAYIYDIVVNCTFDTLVALQCTEGYRDKSMSLGLKSMLKQLYNYDMLEINDFLAGNMTLKNSDVTFADLPYELVRLYACTDGDATLMLMKYIIETQLIEKFKADRVFKEEIIFSMAVAYSEFWGYNVNVEAIPTMKDKTALKMESLTKEMHEMSGSDFSPSSPQQIAEVFYDVLKMPQRGEKRTTDAEMLKEWVNNYRTLEDEPVYPIADLLLQFRKEEGLFKNFFKKLNTFLTEDGTIHPSVFQFGTTTGRASIKEPNYQSYSDIIKQNIIARVGYYMFDCDFSQIEYRVLASIAGQEKLLQEFEDPDMDYHTYQASRMFNVPYAAVPKTLRAQSKGINFGLPYGMGDSSLGARIFGARTSENTLKAAALRTKFFEGQEKILAFFEGVRQEGIDRGYTSTYFGRNRFYDKATNDESSIRRQAGNHVIQGTAADIYKMAVNRMFLRVIQEGWLGLVLFNAFVHDELVMEVHKSINPYYFMKVWREEFQLKIEGFCPLYAGAGVGYSWYEAKSQDLPVQFIQEIIDVYDNNPEMEWNDDYHAYIKYTNEAYYEYKHRRIREAITDVTLDHKVVKPNISGLINEMVLKAINNLALEGTQEEMDSFNYKYGTTFRLSDKKYKEKALESISFYKVIQMYCDYYKVEATITVYAPTDADKELEFLNEGKVKTEISITDELTNFDIVDLVLYNGYYINESDGILFLTDMPVSVGGQQSTMLNYFASLGVYGDSGAYQVGVVDIETKEVLLYSARMKETDISKVIQAYSVMKGQVAQRW